jgi:hypothetical protein
MPATLRGFPVAVDYCFDDYRHYIIVGLLLDSDSRTMRCSEAEDGSESFAFCSVIVTST